MARSEFLPFAWNAAANVMTQAQWEANPATMNGFSAGIARSREANKAWRQPAFITASLAQLIPEILDEDALDDGDRPKMTNQIERLIGAIANIYVDVKEAPIDNITYGRRNAVWTRVPSWEELWDLFVPEAPSDNITYGRRNRTWIRVLNWDEAWGNFLPLIGGQMYGFIRLHAWPQDDYHAVPMGWVIAYVQGELNRLNNYLPLTGGSLSNPGHLNIYGNLNVVGGMVAYPYGDTHVSNSLYVGGYVYAGRYVRNDGGPGTLHTHGGNGITFHWDGSWVQFFIDGTYVGNNQGQPGLGEAPHNNQVYARQNSTWVDISALLGGGGGGPGGGGTGQTWPFRETTAGAGNTSNLQTAAGSAGSVSISENDGVVFWRPPGGEFQAVIVYFPNNPPVGWQFIFKVGYSGGGVSAWPAGPIQMILRWQPAGGGTVENFSTVWSGDNPDTPGGSGGLLGGWGSARGMIARWMHAGGNRWLLI